MIAIEDEADWQLARATSKNMKVFVLPPALAKSVVIQNSRPEIEQTLERCVLGHSVANVGTEDLVVGEGGQLF